MKKEKMYFDFDPIAYNFIINTNILRQKQKRIFEDLVEGKIIKQNKEILEILKRKEEK